MTVMTTAIVQTKPFEPGTTGWTVDDLDDPQIERRWFEGRYEIVEGVLTTMPPAYFDGSLPAGRLIRMVERYLDHVKQSGDFASEVDLVVGPRRVARVDFVFLTPQDRDRQEKANAARGRRKLKYGRLLVPPTLIIESVSIGHEAHDAETKLQWYESFGVPNYWMIDGYERTLRCLVLENGKYRIDQDGKGPGEVRPSLFPGLTIPLIDLWP